jgi:hypothetical protein
MTIAVKQDGDDGGDDGDGVVRMLTPDLRTSSVTALPQETSSWLES